MSFRLIVEHNQQKVELTLDDLKKFPTTTITATVQCAGQRRSEFKEVRPGLFYFQSNFHFFETSSK